MRSGGYVAKPQSSVDSFIRALRSYRPSFEGIRSLSQAASDVALPELRQASLGLQKLIKSERGIVGASRFASAPKKIYPDRAEVMGYFLATLSQSPNARVKAFAAELGAAWFKSVAPEVGIYGKY